MHNSIIILGKPTISQFSSQLDMNIIITTGSLIEPMFTSLLCQNKVKHRGDSK